VKPGYEQKFYPDEEKRGKWRLIASADGRDNSVTIHQDVNLYAALLDPGEEIVHVIPQNRHAWLQVARGQIVVNGQKLVHGDGLAVSNEERLTVSADILAEVLLFDLS
jgi:redox-sensitive bicupin YhaK (pirin superfamily)